MSILNKFLAAAIALLVIQGIIIELIPRYSCIMRYADHSLVFATALVPVMMLSNGTFMASRYFSFAKVGFGVLVLGVCFKVLHLTGADQILVLAPSLVFLSYGIHFIMKRPKAPLDFLKFATMLSFLIPIPLLFFNAVSERTATVLEILGVVLLWCTFLLFLLTERKKLWAKRISTP